MNCKFMVELATFAQGSLTIIAQDSSDGGIEIFRDGHMTGNIQSSRFVQIRGEGRKWKFWRFEQKGSASTCST